MNLVNCLITASRVDEEWSEPIFLNSSGFDPSLFHDDDNRKWLVNMQWDRRPGRNRFAGILLQEYSPKEKRLVGERRNIFLGTSLGLTEGPHLYKRNGYYYLLTAEGGTGYDHAVTFARSRSIEGPYEVHPCNPMLTSRKKANAHLKKAGHASLVESVDGSWYMAHLCSRPITRENLCPLGRETAIQKVVWRNDWLYLQGGGNMPADHFEAEGASSSIAYRQEEFYHFDTQEMPSAFQSLRVPVASRMSLSARKGYLRLYGKDTLASLFEQTLVARRFDSFQFDSETEVFFDPISFEQTAGLVCYYNTKNYYYLYISRHEQGQKFIGILTCINGVLDEPCSPFFLVADGPIILSAQVRGEDLRFAVRHKDRIQEMPIILNAGYLSDDHVAGDAAFTGAFIGLCCQDTSGTLHPADFRYFKYTRIDSSTCDLV
jgi:xylan 1,4-beta-xylosidase